MSPQYVGLPTAARNYAASYFRALIPLGVVLAITGALGALIINFVYPEVFLFYGVAFASVSLHVSALYVRDVWGGDYEPSQTEFASGSQFLAVLIVLGISDSGLLVLGTLVAAGAVWMGAPLGAAVAIAAYYPVIDLVLLRNGYWTPGAIITAAGAWAIVATMNVPNTLVGSLPVIGKGKRPQA